MRRGVAVVGATLACVFGLAACGGSSSKLIPAANAVTLGDDLTALSTALEDNDCNATTVGIDQLQADIDALPTSVSAALRDDLVSGETTLATHAPRQCKPPQHSTGPSGPSGSDTALIAGRYRIESRLGSGGMSTVHLAFDERLERYVAVKLLAEHLADDPAFVSRFQREALAAARLIHPNIVQVFDSGLDDAPRPALHRDGVHRGPVVRGDPARPRLADRRRDAADHARRLRRARLRPPQGRRAPRREAGQPAARRRRAVKLADFGIAKATEQSSITQIGSVLGTAAYLAPEQGRGEEAGPPADIYALGVVTYQLLSGRLPFEGASLTELAIKQQREPPVPLDELVAAVSPKLAAAVASRCGSTRDSATRRRPRWRARSRRALSAASRPGPRHGDRAAVARCLPPNHRLAGPRPDSCRTRGAPSAAARPAAPRAGAPRAESRSVRRAQGACASVGARAQ
jgi:hypothetical protein